MSIAYILRSVFSDVIAKVHAINRRYATPRLAMSKHVRLALLCLRIYLLILVGLLAYKFISIVIH